MVLIAGVNGSGKSTFTRTAKHKNSNLKIIDPDTIARNMTGSFATVDNEQLAAGKAALMAVQQCIAEKKSFLVESTLSGRLYIKYLQQARQNGFKTILVYVALKNAELSAERVKIRVGKGGHNIPIKDIQRRYPKSFKNFKEHMRLCDLAYVYDNSDHYKLVATYRDGILHRQSDVPAWLSKYL